MLSSMPCHHPVGEQDLVTVRLVSPKDKHHHVLLETSTDAVNLLRRAADSDPPRLRVDEDLTARLCRFCSQRLHCFTTLPDKRAEELKRAHGIKPRVLHLCVHLLLVSLPPPPSLLLVDGRKASGVLAFQQPKENTTMGALAGPVHCLLAAGFLDVPGLLQGRFQLFLREEFHGPLEQPRLRLRLAQVLQ